jgi:hypothetical protein
MWVHPNPRRLGRAVTVEPGEDEIYADIGKDYAEKTDDGEQG